MDIGKYASWHSLTLCIDSVIECARRGLMVRLSKLYYVEVNAGLIPALYGGVFL